MTTAMLAKMICLSSGIFGRPAWDDVKCAEHAEYIMDAAQAHDVSPILMVAENIVECDMREKDNPIVKIVGKTKRKVVVGYDACPMGVRIMGVDRRARYDARRLYDVAAFKLARWKKWCSKKHAGQGHHYVSHYNEGNPDYADQVLAVTAVLSGRSTDKYVLVPRITDIVRRLSKVFVRGWWSPNS